MTAFINTFLSYGLLVVIMGALVVSGVFLGKKLRDAKENKSIAEVANSELESK